MAIDNQKMLTYWLYGLGLVVAFIIYSFFTSMAEVVTTLFFTQLDLPEMWVQAASATLSIVLVVLLVEYIKRQEKTNRFGSEVVAELRKVAWPSWLDVRGTTLVVIGVTLVISLILFVFDKIYDGLLTLVF